MSIGNPFMWLTQALQSANIVSNIEALIVYAIFIAVLISVFDYLFGWVERKMIAKAHLRHGPTYVGKYGILQNLADFIKLLSKENIIPRNADRLLFMTMLPLLLAFSVFLIFLVPLSPTLQATNLGLGLLIIFVTLSFVPSIVFLGGVATGNKFADISAQRSVIMLVSYELPVILVLVAVSTLANGFNLGSIVAAQSPYWFIILMPLGFVIFFIGMLAELERPPFDIREADSELIAGWFTDYSSPYYMLGLFLDYTRMLLGSLLIAIIFLGGWLGPSFLPPMFWLLAKAVIISLAIVFIRVATVRMRINSLLRFGWIYLLPLSIINLIVTFIIFVK